MADEPKQPTYAEVLARSKLENGHMLWNGCMKRGSPVMYAKGKKLIRIRPIAFARQHPGDVVSKYGIRVACGDPRCLTHLVRVADTPEFKAFKAKGHERFAAKRKPDGSPKNCDEFGFRRSAERRTREYVADLGVPYSVFDLAASGLFTSLIGGA